MIAGEQLLDAGLLGRVEVWDELGEGARGGPAQAESVAQETSR